MPIPAPPVRKAEAGFTSLWLMDHVIQIPQVGREWEDMLESHTTLGFLAGVTERIRLGTLVTGITYRNIAHLAKIVATLDVLSGGRAMCGIGAAWFEREHRLYGWEFPPLRERFARLEDALELLPLMWGPGAPAFEGRTIRVAESVRARTKELAIRAAIGSPPHRLRFLIRDDDQVSSASARVRLLTRRAKCSPPSRNAPAATRRAVRRAAVRACAVSCLAPA